MRPAAASVSVNGVSKPGLTGAVEIQCLDEGPEIGLCIPLFMNENLNRAGANKYKSAGAGSTNVRGPGPKRRFECRAGYACGLAAAGWRFFAGRVQAAVKTTSVDELRAVSAESWTTPMMKPTPTTCMAMSLEMPNRLQATGMSSSDPPATPEAPQALIAATTLSSTAVKKSTGMLRVWTAAMVMTVMVMAAPAILMVAPSGMEME